MPMFGKKNHNSTAVQPVVPQAPAKNPMTKVEMVRQSKNVIDSVLENFNDDHEMFDNMMDAAENYRNVLKAVEKKLEELKQAEEAGSDDEEKIRRSVELLQERQELYFGGLIKSSKDDSLADPEEMKVLTKSGTFILPEDVQDYIEATKFLAGEFYKKDAASTVTTGADRLIDSMKQIVSELKDAFVNGKKLKANSCIDLMKYIIVIGYSELGGSSEQENEEIVQNRIKFVNETGKALLASLDEYYKSLRELDVWDTDRLNIYHETMECRARYESLGEDIRRKIENVDFKNELEKYPPGSEIRKQYHFFLECDTKSTRLMRADVQIENLLFHLTTLKSQICELLVEFQLAFTDNGRRFNPAEQLRTMEKVRSDCRNEAIKMQQFMVDSHELDERTKSQLLSLSTNAKLGQTIADAAKNTSRLYAFLDEQQELKRIIEENRRKYDLERKKRKQEEKEKRRQQKMEEQQEEAQEIEQTEEPEYLENEE